MEQLEGAAVTVLLAQPRLLVKEMKAPKKSFALRRSGRWCVLAAWGLVLGIYRNLPASCCQSLCTLSASLVVSYWGFTSWASAVRHNPHCS